jgi:hypothetical protein
LCQVLLGYQPIPAMLRGREQTSLHTHLHVPHTDAELLGDCRRREPGVRLRL